MGSEQDVQEGGARRKPTDFERLQQKGEPVVIGGSSSPEEATKPISEEASEDVSEEQLEREAEAMGSGQTAG